MSIRTVSSLPFLCAALLSAGCSSTVQLSSLAPEEPVRIDGSTAEWSGRLERVDDGRATIGVQHDDDRIFVTFITRDRGSLQRIMAAGFTVWFDGAGGKHKSTGIRFPLGFAGRPSREPERQAPAGFDRPAQGGPFDVLRDDGTTERFGPDASEHVRIRAMVDPGSFVYELAVDRAFVGAVDLKDSVLGVGFETGEIDGRPAGEPPSAGGPPTGGGRRGRARGGTGGEGLMPGGAGPNGAGPIRIWAQVRLDG